MKDYVTGTVDHFDKEEGYGFLRHPRGKDDIYLHISDLEGSKAPTKANILKFRILETEKGLKAKDAKIID